jgi:hypothetical protein
VPFTAQAAESETNGIGVADRPRHDHHESVKEVTGMLRPPNEILGDAIGDLDAIFDVQ